MKKAIVTKLVLTMILLGIMHIRLSGEESMEVVCSNDSPVARRAVTNPKYSIYEVNRSIGDYSNQWNISTPEDAVATWYWKVDAESDPKISCEHFKKLIYDSGMSLGGARPRDFENRPVSRLNAKKGRILKVCTFGDSLALVIVKCDPSEAEKVNDQKFMPYQGTCFTRVRDGWRKGLWKYFDSVEKTEYFFLKMVDWLQQNGFDDFYGAAMGERRKSRLRYREELLNAEVVRAMTFRPINKPVTDFSADIAKANSPEEAYAAQILLRAVGDEKKPERIKRFRSAKYSRSILKGETPSQWSEEEKKKLLQTKIIEVCLYGDKAMVVGSSEHFPYKLYEADWQIYDKTTDSWISTGTDYRGTPEEALVAFLLTARKEVESKHRDAEDKEKTVILKRLTDTGVIITNVDKKVTDYPNIDAPKTPEEIYVFTRKMYALNDWSKVQQRMNILIESNTITGDNKASFVNLMKEFFAQAEMDREMFADTTVKTIYLHDNFACVLGQTNEDIRDAQFFIRNSQGQWQIKIKSWDDYDEDEIKALQTIEKHFRFRSDSTMP